jgi:hypothetical protein
MSTRSPHPTLFIDLQVFTEETYMTFEGITVNPRDNGWYFTIRARNRAGEALYASMWFDTLDEGLFRLYRALSSRNGRDLWKRDRYRK